MKVCKILFLDYGKSFDKTEELIIELLERKYEVVISQEPDYLFYSCGGFDHLAPKYSKCIKIFYTCENTLPDFNFCDYAMAHQHIQFQDRYYRMPYFMLDRAMCDTEEDANAPTREFEKMPDICPLPIEEALNRNFCCFLSSSGWADPVRYEFFEKLSNYKHIDSGGTSLNNMGNVKVPNKMAFLKNYRFCMAFENSSTSGYTTEKIMNAFAANTVPIYWGDPDVGVDFNKDAFICVKDFATIDDAIAEIVRLDNDQNAYLKKLYAPRSTGANYAKWVDGLYLFLTNIVDQPIEKAKRNTDYGLNNSHTRDMTVLRLLFSKNKTIGKFNRKVLRFIQRLSFRKLGYQIPKKRR